LHFGDDVALALIDKPPFRHVGQRRDSSSVHGYCVGQLQAFNIPLEIPPIVNVEEEARHADLSSANALLSFGMLIRRVAGG
jgi:hypothetical protein